MKYKNIDGIKYNPVAVRPKSELVTALHLPVRKVFVDGIRPSVVLVQKNIQKKPAPISTFQSLKVPALRSQPKKKKSYFNQRAYQNLILPLVLFVALAAFVGGMGFALQTPKSVAEAQPVPITPAGIAGNLGDAPPANTPIVSNDALFNTPLELLQNYFQNPSDAHVLADRKILIKKYLQERQSPLVNDAGIIAEQPHWQLILAISFAESTLGKKCFEFNCSGIGGSNLRSYKSFANWILDFNRLLDKRYKSWTLDQMCGVYVQPCTQNWLNATKQILDELKNKNIN